MGVCSGHLGNMAPLHRCSSGHPSGRFSGTMSSSASWRCAVRLSSQDEEIVRRAAMSTSSARGVRKCRNTHSEQAALFSSTSPDTGSRHSAQWARCHGQRQSHMCPGRAATRFSTPRHPLCAEVTKAWHMRGEVAVALVQAAQQLSASAHHEGQVANGGVSLEAHGALRGDLRLGDELVPRR